MDNEEMHWGSPNISSYYVTALERYESLLDEFSNPNESIHHEIILQKIFDCSRIVDQLLELDNGTFMEPLFRLQNNLQHFYEDIVERKKHYDFEQSLTPSRSAQNKPQNSEGSKFMEAVKNLIEKPKVKGLSEIAGLWETKNILRATMILPQYQPQLFENRKLCNRLLFYGPPGIGKTLLAHGVAAEMKALFYSISVSDILSCLFGETEKMIKSLFKHARENKEYSVVFIDEIDGFCRKRNASEAEHTRRLKTEIMCQMTGIENCRNMFVICATNCPWDLDSAVLRRFQKRIFISLPNTVERYELLKFYISNTALKTLEPTEWEEILNLTEGFSSSDLATLTQNALDIPIKELQDTILWKKTIDDFYEPADADDLMNAKIFGKNLDELPRNSVRARDVKMADLILEAKIYKPTVSKEDMDKYYSFNGK